MSLIFKLQSHRGDSLMKVTGESNTEKSPRAVQQLTSHFLHRESHFEHLEFYDLFAEISFELILVGPERTVMSARPKLSSEVDFFLQLFNCIFVTDDKTPFCKGHFITQSFSAFPGSILKKGSRANKSNNSDLEWREA